MFQEVVFLIFFFRLLLLLLLLSLLFIFYYRWVQFVAPLGKYINRRENIFHLDGYIMKLYVGCLSSSLFPEYLVMLSFPTLFFCVVWWQSTVPTLSTGAVGDSKRFYDGYISLPRFRFYLLTFSSYFFCWRMLSLPLPQHAKV